MMNQDYQKAVLSPENDLRQAQIANQIENLPFNVQTMVLDLSTAKLSTAPLRIGFPFQSIMVQDATDTSTNVQIKIGTRDEMQSAFTLKKGDSWSRKKPVPEAFIHWDAQASKSITLVFFVDSEFRSGSMISVNSGGVSISEGSTVSGPTRVTLSAATAAAILPANSDRKVATLQNKTGAALYIAGDNTVTNSGATEGIELADDQIIEWKNTAALYGYSVAGGTVSYIEEE